MEFVARTRKIGGSLWILIPTEVVRLLSLKTGQTLQMNVIMKKKATIALDEDVSEKLKSKYGNIGSKEINQLIRKGLKK